MGQMKIDGFIKDSTRYSCNYVLSRMAEFGEFGICFKDRGLYIIYYIFTDRMVYEQRKSSEYHF